MSAPTQSEGEILVTKALFQIRDILDEIREGLPWPVGEHVSFKIDSLNKTLASLEDT